MEKAIVHTLDILNTVSKDMENATAELKGISVDQFNRDLLNLLRSEIEKAKVEASHWRYMSPYSKTYQYQNRFPTNIYNSLSKDFLEQLNKQNIFIFKYRCTHSDEVFIQIIFHF